MLNNGYMGLIRQSELHYDMNYAVDIVRRTRQRLRHRQRHGHGGDGGSGPEDLASGGD